MRARASAARAHLQHEVTADLLAPAASVNEPTRRRLIPGDAPAPECIGELVRYLDAARQAAASLAERAA